MLFRDDLKQKKVVQINVPHKKNMMCLNESTLDPFPILKEVFLRKMQKVHLNRYFNDISKSLLLKLSDYAGVRQENLVIGNGAD
ncbi:MAG: histidinol-phosphate aminotransferase family protein, partial [Candidatus Cloacimonadota bacterium]|nr:histidinol-phosphate aminotransferase family protein [Candidatus Cloacimonadota bacterium]